MAKLSKRQKFLKEKSSFNSNKSWQFTEKQLNQIEFLYGANVRSVYESEQIPPLSPPTRTNKEDSDSEGY